MSSSSVSQSTTPLSMSANSSRTTCITCNRPLGPNYWHRGACGHHQHEHCALPAVRAGKTYCPRCPTPLRPTATVAGTVVLGSDGEQIRLVAAQLRAEREVSYRSSLQSNHGTAATVSAKTTGGAIGRCRGKEHVDNCSGGVLCMHDVHDTITDSALRAACCYRGIEHKHKDAWTQRLASLLEHRPQVALLKNGGVTVSLLAFCDVSLNSLVKTFGYRLETLLECFSMNFADMRLLGFSVTMFADTKHYPLIALYDKANVRADDLFALEISFSAFKKCVLDIDYRYAILLDVNEDYWKRMLGGSNDTVVKRK